MASGRKSMSVETAQKICTTDDAFLGGRLHILQPAKGLRAGIDPIFLAAATKASPGDRVLEAGVGVAVVWLCAFKISPLQALNCRLSSVNWRRRISAETGCKTRSGS